MVRGHHSPHIIFLIETEEFADLGGTLGTKTLGLDNIGQARDIVFSLLDDGKGENREVLGDNAAAD